MSVGSVSVGGLVSLRVSGVGVDVAAVSAGVARALLVGEYDLLVLSGGSIAANDATFFHGCIGGRSECEGSSEEVLKVLEHKGGASLCSTCICVRDISDCASEGVLELVRNTIVEFCKWVEFVTDSVAC